MGLWLFGGDMIGIFGFCLGWMVELHLIVEYHTPISVQVGI